MLLQQWILDSEADQQRILNSAEAPHLLFRGQGASKELADLREYLADPQELAGKLARERAGIRIPA